MAENGSRRKVVSGLMLLGVRSKAEKVENEGFNDDRGEEQEAEEAEEIELDESEVVWFDHDEKQQQQQQPQPEAGSQTLGAVKAAPKLPVRSLFGAMKSTSIAGTPWRRNALEHEANAGLSVALADGPERALRRPNLRRNGIAIAFPVSASKGRTSEEFSGNYPRSAPVNVPTWSPAKPQTQAQGMIPNGNAINGHGKDFFEVFADESDEERLPPHEMLLKQQAREYFNTFSVLEGRGRTLKGSDISRVRDAIWKQIGFDG